MALETELTRTLLVLVIVYIITQLPTFSYTLYRLFLKPGETKICGSVYRFLTPTADTLTVVNSSINFMIYYPCTVKFRSSLHDMVRQISLRPLKSKPRKKPSKTRSSYISMELNPSSCSWWLKIEGKPRNLGQKANQSWSPTANWNNYRLDGLWRKCR